VKTFLVFLLLSANTFAAKNTNVQTRWQELFYLVNQEIKVLENAKNKGPDLRYRLLEAYSEKLKLIHEKNNNEFLKAAKTQNVNASKENFFLESRLFYQKVKEFGHAILKDHPRYKRVPEVYYTLALNSRDFGRDNITEKYLLTTLSLLTIKDANLKHHAMSALADHYYNEKEFTKAVSYYEKVIKNDADDWQTKHLFNLSWCYLKTRSFDAAIETLHKSYFLSKDARYINIKDQVLENLGSFHVYTGRVNEGLDFYLTNEKDPSQYLITFARRAYEKGHEKETEKIFAAAEKLQGNGYSPELKEELLHAYLDFYRHYSRISDHLEASDRLTKYYLSEAKKDPKARDRFPVAMKDDAIEKMRSTAGYLQLRLAKDMKRDTAIYNKDELKMVLSYFDLLTLIDIKKVDEYHYFRGETYFSVHAFKEAAPQYVACTELSGKAKNLDLARKCINSLLSLTGQEALSEIENNKFLAFAYENHIKLWPRDEKSEQIYPKLFALYMTGKSDSDSTRVLRLYHKSYPEKLEHQQQLMTEKLDQYIETKNTPMLATWIKEFRQGFLNFPVEKVNQTELVLGQILFMNYQELAKAGEKVKAAEGFESIYKDPIYPRKIKSEAAYFASLSYLDAGDTLKSYTWLGEALPLMTKEEKMSYREDQLKMTERYYLLQDTTRSMGLAEIFLKYHCSFKDKTQDRFYEVAMMMSLVNDKPDEAERMIKTYQGCLSESHINRDYQRVFDYHSKVGDFFPLKNFVSRHPNFKDQYILTLQNWFWDKTDYNTKVLILAEFKKIPSEEAKTIYQEIGMYQKFMRETEALMDKVIWEREVFDAAAFNQALTQYLKDVQQVKNQYENLTGSSQINLALKLLARYQHFFHQVALKIKTLRPQNMSAEIYKDFSAAMGQVAMKFDRLSLNYQTSVKSTVSSKQLLTSGTRSLASVEGIENPIMSFTSGLTMDFAKE
jgi:hypothetical protein